MKRIFNPFLSLDSKVQVEEIHDKAIKKILKWEFREQYGMLFGMAYIPYCEHHLFQLLEEYGRRDSPLDLAMAFYFRAHRSLGSKDRAFIAETAYDLIRWLGLIDYLSGEANPSWQKRFQIYKETDFEKIQSDNEMPEHVRASFPLYLFDLLVKNYGLDKARALCLASNTRAPTTLRVNSLKTTRDELLSHWKDQYDVSATKVSPDGIVFHQKINFFECPEFKKGFFEVQDEGSQLLCHLVKAEPKQRILDYCAGSGGKTLGFAPAMKGSGQIYVHDIRPHALQEAKKRLKRAGVQNYQILLPDSSEIRKLKKKMDVVLVDAPCSGTGTLRRNPDMKWKFDEEVLDRLIGQQRMIFEKALSFLSEEGRIIYSTCSILTEENQAQVEHFLSTYSLQIEGEIFQSFPAKGEMDGFFGVVLRKVVL